MGIPIKVPQGRVRGLKWRAQALPEEAAAADVGRTVALLFGELAGGELPRLVLPPGEGGEVKGENEDEEGEGDPCANGGAGGAGGGGDAPAAKRRRGTIE
jgi:hypothetical protein